MKPFLSPVRVFSAAALALALTGCANVKVTHVPPGESLNVALAKRPELVRLPAPATGSETLMGAMPPVEPELPGTSLVERVAEAYSRGEFCLGAGKDEEAIAAFEEAVKIDPAFTEAWQQLAMLHEKQGNAKKAVEAFRRAKKVAAH